MVDDFNNLKSNDIILKHLNFAHKAAQPYIATVPQKKDIIISAAYEGITLAVNRIKNNPPAHKNLKSFIWVTITGTIQDTLHKDCLVQCPRGQERYKYKSLVGLKAHVPEVNPFAESDLIKTLRMTQVEQDILKLRVEGYTLIEIGMQLSLSHTTVSNKLSSLVRRLK